LSEIQLVLGNDWWRCEDYHFGLNLRMSIPTGTRPHGKYLFEPVVGNGHHWEIGAGLTGHYTFWQSCDSSQSTSLWIDLNVTHLFNARQCRNFDLCQSPNSRYMLAQRIGQPVEDCLQGNLDPAIKNALEQLIIPANDYTLSNYQFKNLYTPVANLTQSRIKVSAPIQIDFSALLNFNCGCYNVDLGYNLWYRGCEKIKFDYSSTSPLETHAWALKGDAHVFSYQLIDPSSGLECDDNPITIGETVALAATQHSANIYAGTNRPCDTTLNVRLQSRNPGIDNAQFAYTTDDPDVCDDTQQPLLSSSAPNNCDEVISNENDNETGIQTRTSIQPKFLSTADVDCAGASTKGLSHKIFAHVSRTWAETECGHIPYLGVGAKIEVAVHNSCCQGPKTCFTTAECNPCASSCRKCALSEWGIWVKGGISFD